MVSLFSWTVIGFNHITFPGLAIREVIALILKETQNKMHGSASLCCLSIKAVELILAARETPTGADVG